MADEAELAGWVVTARVRCPDCGEVHELQVLASELVGAGMDCDGVFYGRDLFLCEACSLGDEPGRSSDLGYDPGHLNFPCWFMGEDPDDL